LVAIRAFGVILPKLVESNAQPNKLAVHILKKNPRPTIHKDLTIDLVSAYRELFKAVVASNDSLREEAYRLRFSVYCVDLRWEKPDHYPDGMERDAFDAASIHCLLLHRPSGLYAGTVRLVTTPADASVQAMPLLGHCGEGFFAGPYHPALQAPGTVGEISRLALRREFRRRLGEAETPEGHGAQLFEWQPSEQRCFPHIAVGLYLAASAVALANGLAGVYAMMEPRLARHLRQGGIHFAQIGEAVEFRGTRAPYYISRQMLFRELSRPLRDLLLAIAADMRLEISASGPTP
jgi:N-acyl amino acid synthase of PEP-CTERM/exosortase system